MAQARQNTASPGASDWLFESITTSLRANSRNLIWVCGAFLLASFLNVAFNLGAIENLAFQAFSVEGSFESTMPIRVMMAVACFVMFAAVTYVVVEQQRLELGLEYLARQEHTDALQLGSFSKWLQDNHPVTARAKGLSTAAFLIFCAAILVIDVATLFYSFSN